MKCMFGTPKKQVIDHRTIKLIVGLIALTLAGLTNFFSGNTIPSISASYYEGGWSQSIFVGFLFAVAACLLSYNGWTRTEMILSKIAAVTALGVALFPCKCNVHVELIPYVHGLSAAIMFLILAYFCYRFFIRARDKGHMQAYSRAAIYAICGLLILTSIVALATDNFTGGSISAMIPRFTFYGEATGLTAFGVSWLTASHVLPFFNRAKDELFLPFADQVPDDGSK